MFALLVEPPTFSTIVNRDHKTDRNDEYIRLAGRIVINKLYIGQKA